MEVHSELGLLRGKNGEVEAIIGCAVRSCVKRQQKLANFLFQRDCTILQYLSSQGATD